MANETKYIKATVITWTKGAAAPQEEDMLRENIYVTSATLASYLFLSATFKSPALFTSFCYCCPPSDTRAGWDDTFPLLYTRETPS